MAPQQNAHCLAITIVPMANDQHAQEPTQPTRPKEGEPVEIPVPKVSTIRAAIRKIAQPVKPERGE